MGSSNNYLFHLKEITILERKTYDLHANLAYGDILVDNSQDPSIISLLIDQTIKN